MNLYSYFSTHIIIQVTKVYKNYNMTYFSLFLFYRKQNIKQINTKRNVFLTNKQIYSINTI